MQKRAFRLLSLTSAIFGVFSLSQGQSVEAAPRQGQTAMVLECRPGDTNMTPVEEARCACEAALKRNTIEALENFLLKYGATDTQCDALASTALAQFGPTSGGNGRSGDSPITPRDEGVYGR